MSIKMLFFTASDNLVTLFYRITSLERMKMKCVCGSVLFFIRSANTRSASVLVFGDMYSCRITLVLFTMTELSVIFKNSFAMGF